MKTTPEVSGVSIVVIGNFNPSIFHPAWFFRNDIEPEVPNDLVDIEVCHKDVSRFSVDGTLYFVDQERFQIQSAAAPWVRILDKTARIFSELLLHTPTRAFGINRDVHFSVGSPKKRMEIGRQLAPVEPWGKFGAEMGGLGSPEPGGMLSLTMRSSEMDDAYSIQKNIKIEPSALIQDGSGIYMQANFHFAPKVEVTTTDLVAVMQKNFQLRINEAENIFNQIMEL